VSHHVYVCFVIYVKVSDDDARFLKKRLHTKPESQKSKKKMKKKMMKKPEDERDENPGIY
jgi:hypothetical protein